MDPLPDRKVNKRGGDYRFPIEAVQWGTAIAALSGLSYFGLTFSSPPPPGKGSSLAQQCLCGFCVGLLVIAVGIVFACCKYVKSKRHPADRE